MFGAIAALAVGGVAGCSNDNKEEEADSTPVAEVIEGGEVDGEPVIVEDEELADGEVIEEEEVE